MLVDTKPLMETRYIVYCSILKKLFQFEWGVCINKKNWWR
jgi:hypothetical protein